MQLFMSATSPFARKVRVLIREKGLTDRVEEVLTDPMPSPANLLAMNPLGKVPVLLTDDDEALCESALICDYLDNLDGAPSYIPQNPDERRIVLQRQALADGVLNNGVLLLMEGRRPEEQRSPFWMDRWTQAILRTLKALNETRPSAAEDLTLDRIALGCALGYMDFRLPHIDWREDALNLVTFWRDIARRPSFAETTPPTQ